MLLTLEVNGVVNMKSKNKTKFFPFSPGVPWKIDGKKCIIPEINKEIWDSIVKPETIINIVCYGDFVCSMFSLSFIEAMKRNNRNNVIRWIGNDHYSFLINYHGLAKPSHITRIDLKKYPVPLFMDKEKNVYINVMHNCFHKYNYWGTDYQKQDGPIFEQMFKNSFSPWDRSYLPKMRNIGSDFIENILRTGRAVNNKIICIVDDATENDVLKWTVQQIKEFMQIAISKNYTPIIFARNTKPYRNYSLVFDIEERHVFQVLKKSILLLSNQREWTFASLLFSNAKVFSMHEEGPLDLIKNADYIGCENHITSMNTTFKPLEVIEMMEML
jgi:hypothetical protein